MKSRRFWRRRGRASRETRADQQYPSPQSTPAPVSGGGPEPADADTGVVDADVLERFRQQVRQHRTYGWEIFEYHETPPVAVLAPSAPARAARRRRQAGAAGRVDDAPARRARFWCRVWVDDGGEVRWQSVPAPAESPVGAGAGERS